MAKKYDDLLKKVDQNIQNQKEYLQVKPFLDSPYASVFEKLGIIQRVDDSPKTVAHTQGEYANPGNNIQQNFTPRGIEYGLSDNPRLGHNFEASQTGNQTLDAFLNQLQVAEQQRQAQAAQEQARKLAEQQRQANQQNRVNSRLNQIDARDNALNTLPVVNTPQSSPIPENVMDLIAPQTANEKNPYLPTVQARQPYNSWLQGMRAYQDENGNIIRDEEGNTYHIPINRESDGYNAHTVSNTGINAIDKIIDSINYINQRGSVGFESFNDQLNSFGSGVLNALKGNKKPVFQSSTNQSGAIKSQKEFEGSKANQAARSITSAVDKYYEGVENASGNNTADKSRQAIEKKYAVAASLPVVGDLGNLSETVSAQLPYMAINAAIPGSGFLNAGNVTSAAARGVLSATRAYSEARSEGASVPQAQVYAGLEAINQGAFDLLIGGMLGSGEGILDHAIARSAMGRSLAKAYGTMITSPLAKTFFKAGSKVVGEGAEEAIQELITVANKKATYKPDARVNPKEVAYSGLLGGLTAGIFNAANMPSDYRAYKGDVDTVNAMSQAAAAVKSVEEARYLNLQMDLLIDECNINLGEYAAPVNETDFDMRARYEYIKNGIQTVKDAMNADLDAIIDSNTKFNDAVTNIANAPADNIVNETASLVAAVSDTVEPEEDVVKATIDRVNEEIQDINATEQDIRGMSDAEFADWWYNARFKNAFPGLVDAMNHVPNNLLTSGDALAQQIAERNARYQQNPENNARFDNEAGLHIDAYKQGVITQLEMQKNILANIDSILRNQKNEVKEAVTDLLTPNANGDTIETKNPVVQADGESLAPVHNETPAPGEPKYIMKRGTYTAPGTNETYDLIQKPRNLSKQEYAELKKAVMDNGGLGWNKNANGFLIRPGRLDDVRKALEKIGVGIEGETPAQTATEAKPTGNVQTPNETVPQFEVAGSTTETLTGERGDIPQFEVVGDTNIVPATETGIQNQNGGAVDETVRNGNTETTTNVNPPDLNGTGVKKTPSTKTETAPQREPEEEKKPVKKWTPQSKDKLTVDNFPYELGTMFDHTSVATGQNVREFLVHHDENGIVIGTNEKYKTVKYEDLERLIKNGYYKVYDPVSDNVTNHFVNEYRNQQQKLGEKKEKETKQEDTSSKKPDEPEKSDEPADTNAKAAKEIADWVKRRLDGDHPPFSKQDLQVIANNAYGGTQAQGAYTVKDMTDALELGINEHLISDISENKDEYTGNANEAKAMLKDIEQFILAKIPTQTNRTEGQIQNQQFSTPPNIAFVANWVANIDDKDTVLEPSAGVGGLASFGKGIGAKVYVNEWDPRRLSLIKQLPFDGFYKENAEHIDRILPESIKPSVVVMNPPFSANGRTKNNTKNAIPHIEQALARLQPGGRLVAILGGGRDEGGGMSDNAPSFKAWWNKLRDSGYDIRANIGIDGSNYSKYGTSFNVRLVVIDKTGNQEEPTLTGEYEDLSEAIEDLEDIRNDRQRNIGKASEEVQSNGTVKGGRSTSESGAKPGGRSSGTGKRSPDGGKSTNAGQSDGDGQSNDDLSSSVSNRPSGKLDVESEKPSDEVRVSNGELESGQGRKPSVNGGSSESGEGNEQSGGMGSREPSGGTSEQSGELVSTETGVPGTVDEVSEYSLGDVLDLDGTRYIVTGFDANGEPQLMLHPYQIGNTVEIDGKKYTIVDFEEDGRPIAEEYREPVKGNASQKYSVKAPERITLPAINLVEALNNGQIKVISTPNSNGSASTVKSGPKTISLSDLKNKAGQGASIKRVGNSASLGPVKIRTPAEKPTTIDDVSVMTPATDTTAPGASGEIVVDERVDPPKKQEKKKAAENDDGVYANYRTSDIPFEGAQKHPAILVESSAMSAVQSPPINYKPKLDQKLIENGVWSDIQLELICYAGQAHREILPSGERKGYCCGDGTGVGKGREIAGIIMDNFNQGRRRAIWITEKAGLIEDAKRDWVDAGGKISDIFTFADSKKKKGFPKEGILFITYDTLKGKPTKGGDPNVDVVEKWFGKDFDGAICFDEAHNMANLDPVKGARGRNKAAEKAIAGNKLQNDLKNARVTYFSATAATEVSNLAYASRLGLWGLGTSFENERDFVSKIGSAGISAMELVARDMKAMGLYLARSITFEGVTYETLNHDLTPVQVAMYNRMSEGWQVVLQNFEKAMEVTGSMNVKAVKQRRAQAYSNMQLFYNQIITSMTMPTVLKDIEKSLDKGQSCVFQLVNTPEAAQDREVQKIKENGGDLDEMDITPRQLLVGYVEKAFPIYQYEAYLDEDGNTQYQIVTDSEGNPVINKEALQMKEDLIADLNEISIPEGPLDQLINYFGADKVAEVTGRSQRVVYKVDEKTGKPKKVLEKRNSVSASIAEAKAFQDGDKRILVFSNAGSTGRSFHSDRRAKNQQKRRHYLLQLGWTASTATQGFGRTNRSNQSEPPSYVLVTTNVKGHKRFVTSIARRLDQLGALTKGQRQTGSGIIGEKDNLESPLSVKALQSFYKKLGSGYYSYYDDDGGLDAQDILHRMGLDKYFYDKYGNFNPNTPVAGEITTFLNRLLALPVEDQNKVFDAFEYERDKFYNEAIENGTLDRGLENVKADKIEIVEESVVYTDPKTGAETKYVKAKLYDKPDVVTTIAEAESKYPGFSGVYRLPDGTVKAAYRRKDTTDSKTGEVVKQFMLIGPNQGKVSNYIESTLNKTCVAIPKKEWQSAWDEELKTVPAYNESEAHMITGALLPIWRKLPSSGTIKAKRITASDGEQYLGRIIAPNIIESVLRQLDVTVKKEKYTGAQIRDMIMKQGKMITFNSDGGGVDIVSRKRVSGEYRIEVSPANAFGFKMIYPDVITESIQSRKRYFIPDSKKGEAILQKMIENGVRSIGDSEDSGQLYSAGPARGRWKVQKDSGVQYSKDESKGKWKLRKRQEGEVLSISELVDEAQRIFGIPINVGKMGPVPRSVQGLFKEFPETIRTRQYGDLPTIAHEIGHWYDKKYRLRESPYIKSVISEFQEDLEKAGYSKSQLPYEAVAEYFREYLSDREATEQKFRQFTNWMYKTINPTDQRRLAEYSGMTNAYFAADLDRRVSAQVHYRTDDNSVQKKAQVVAEELQRNPNEYLGGLSRDFVRAWFDDLVDLRGFGKTYDLAYYEKQARSIAYGRLTSAMTDKHGNIVGKSLADILADAKIDAKNARAFDEYLIARVALDHFEAKERGENVGTLVYGDEELNNADSIAERIDTYERENSTFHDASEKLYEYQNHLLDLAVNSGLMDEELKNRLNELYPHYVPLYRVMDDAKQRTRGAKRGYADQNTPIARFKGSGRDIYSPIESIIQNTEKFTASCMRNDVMVEFANYIDRNEGMGWAAEKVPQAKILDYISTDELGKRLDSFRRNTDRLDKMTEEEKIDLVDSIMAFVGDTLSQWKPAAKQGKNVVSVMRGGKRSYYEVHDEGLYKALTNMDAPQYGFITRTFGAITRANKFFYTSSNPQFIFTNPQRDIVTGFISSTTTDNPARYLWDFGKAYKDAIMNSAEYKEYMRQGGGYMGSVTSDYNILKRVKKDVVKPDQGVIKNFLDHVAELVPRLVDAGESASRLAEWKRAMAQGDDAMTAMRKAQEVTVNFARGGRIVKEINQYVPFFMAGFNAIAHNYDLFVNGGDGGGGRNGNNGFGLDLSPEGRSRRSKAWLKWLLTTGLLAFLTWLFNYIISPKITGESEEEVKKNYDDLSNYNKNAFYNLYIGDHKFFRVKKTQDMAIPSTIVERMVEYYVLDQKDSMNGLTDFCMDQILPVNPFGGEDFVDCVEKAFSEVTLLGTVVDLARNKDFKGSPIVSKSYEYKEAEDQIKPTTSDIWVSVGKAIHASPIQLQYIAEDNFGWAARLVDSLTQVNGERSIGISNKLISDSAYSTDIINDLYDTRDEFEARKKKYAEHPNSDKYSNEDVLGYYKFSKATDLYSDLNARIRAEGNNDIARDMKIQANAFVDTINKTGMTDLDKAVADIAESAGVEIKDIAPYIVTVDHIKTNGVEFPMNFDDMILYYTQAQTAFENAYGQILQSGYDDATSAAMMVQARKYIDSEMKKAWKTKLIARATAENNQ